MSHEAWSQASIGYESGLLGVDGYESTWGVSLGPSGSIVPAMMGFYKALSPWRKTCLSVKLHLLLSLDMSLVNYWKCSTFFSDQSSKELSWTFLAQDCQVAGNLHFPQRSPSFSLHLPLCLCLGVQGRFLWIHIMKRTFQRTWNLPSPVAPKSPNQAPPLQPPKRALAAAAWLTSG